MATESGKKPRFDPEGTRQAILAAAHEEFTENGLSGARVDAIATRTNTVKRMIYYYFGKQGGAVSRRAGTRLCRHSRGRAAA